MILQTSGTTGAPKTVCLTHAHLGHMSGHAAKALSIGDGDICVNPMPLHHVHGIAIGTVLPLTSGGGAVFPARNGGGAVISAARNAGATWYTAAPTIHADVLRAAREAPPQQGELKLRFARSSSSALATATRAGILEVLGIPIFEGLGMTEAASWGLHQKVGPIPPDHGTVGIGHGVEFCVLTATGQVARAPGSVGELLLRGANVITRYEEPSHEDQFIEGWLRSGDRVRVTAAGEIEVIGRLKELIDRGGVLVAPVEVEGALLEHPSIAEAIVFGVPHPTLGQEVVASVVLAAGQSAEPDTIRRWLGGRLAPEKLPRRVLIVSRIPLNAVGKPERIRAGVIFAKALQGDRAPPEGAMEEVLADMVAEVLPGTIARTGDLFLAGADSLVLLRLQIRIEECFGIWLTMDQIAENPSIAALGELLERLSDPHTIAELHTSWAEAAIAGAADIGLRP